MPQSSSAGLRASRSRRCQRLSYHASEPTSARANAHAPCRSAGEPSGARYCRWIRFVSFFLSPNADGNITRGEKFSRVYRKRPGAVENSRPAFSDDVPFRDHSHVFISTSARTFPGRSIAYESPIGPPKSSTTSVMSSRPSRSISSASRAAWSSGRYGAATDLSESPKPRWSGATTRWSRDSSDHVPVQERPRRRAVHQQHNRAGSLVHVVHAPVGRIEMVRPERVQLPVHPVVLAHVRLPWFMPPAGV